jgi:hypothetical protein
MRCPSLGLALLVGLAAMVVWIPSADAAAATGRRSLMQSELGTLTGAMCCVRGWRAGYPACG